MTGLQTRERVDVARRPQPQLPIDPRIAARWVSVRRDQNRRRWRIVVAVLSVVTVLVGAWALARSPFLAVRHVVVRGNAHTGRDAVLTASGLDHRRSMIGVDAGAIDRRVRALPWVSQVRVRRDWPTTVTIEVTERSPLAQVDGTAGQRAVVDDAGRVLEVVPGASRASSGQLPSLPVLAGISVPHAAGQTLPPVAQATLRVLEALQGATHGDGNALSTFTVTAVTRMPDGTVTASLSPGPITVIVGAADQLAAKIVALRSVLAQGVGGAATIDVEVANVPVLTNGASANPVLTNGKNSTSVSTTQRG